MQYDRFIHGCIPALTNLHPPSRYPNGPWPYWQDVPAWAQPVLVPGRDPLPWTWA